MKLRSAPFGLGALCAALLVPLSSPAAGSGPAPDVLNTANYAFATTTTGSLADLTTGSTLLIGPNQLDYSTPLTPIGFDFYFRGVRQTQFSVNANGLLQFASLAQTGSPYTPLAQSNKPLLTPYGASLRLHSTGKVHSKLFGSAPNRMLVVEWRNLQSVPVPGGDPELTFQAQLFESTGVIRYVYGSMTLAASVAADPNTRSPHIGFSTSDTAGTVGSVAAPQAGSPSYNGSSASPQFNNYTAGPLTVLTSAADGSRRTLAFTPPVPTPPTNLSFSAVQLAGMTLSWTDAPDEQGYALYASTDGVNFSYFDAVGENVTSYAATDLVTTTTYHWRVYSISEGALSATPLAGSQATLAGAFSGTFTVGPTGSYASVGAAVGALAAGGTTGPVNLELQPAYLGTAETYPLTIPRIPGATAATPVTIRPAPGASGLSLSSAAATTLDLNNCRSVVLDGRPGGAGSTPQLTIANTSTSGIAVRFRNDASRNTLRYVTAAGVNTAATGGVILFDTTTGTTGNDDNLIEACVVRDGATTPTNGIASLGTTTTQAHFNSGNVVQNCSILNFFAPGTASRGIQLGAGSTDWTIQGNSLYQTATRAGSTGLIHMGINVENTSGHGFTVANNVIGGSGPNAAGAPWTLGPLAQAVRFRGISISCGFDRLTSVQGNTLTNFALNTASTQTPANGGPFCGIYLTAGKVACGTIAGNTIGAATGTGAITLTTNFTGGTSVGILANANGVQPTIANNQIGSITVAGSGNTVSHSFQGIALTAASISGTNVVVGNTIGSATTASSIQTATPSTSATVQSLIGISLAAGANVDVVGNLIANLQNNYAPAATTTARVLGGIVCTASVPNIVGNTIRNLGTGADATGTGLNAGVVGILQNATAAASSSISQNLVHSLANTHPTAATQIIGIRQNSAPANASVVARNFVHSLSLGSNSPSASIVGLAAAGGLNSYQNNFIALGYDAAGTSLANGLQILGLHHAAGDNNTFYHNSIALGGSGVGGATDTFAFQSDLASVLRDVRNNAFSNARSNGAGTGSHYAVQVGGSGLNPAGLTMDYNLFFTSGTGGVFGRYNGAPVASLTDWRAATGVDLNSLFGNPNFLQAAGNASTVDLHIQPSGSPVEGNGTALAAVTIDFDGQTRASLTPTDIGADGGDFVAGDLQGPEYAFTPLADTTATSARTLRAFIFDGGSAVPYSGAGVPRLYWRTEATGYAAVAGVSQGDGFYDFTFGGGVTQGVRIFYYLVAQDLASPPNVTASPLGGAAGFSTTPPAAATPPTNPYSYTVRRPISGSFTVGAGGSFGALNTAIDYVNRSVLTGPTTLLLTDATYPIVAVPILFEDNPGSSAVNTLAIKPQAGVSPTIEGSGSSVLCFAGADYVTIECDGGAGQTFTLRQLNPSPSAAVVALEGEGGPAGGASFNLVRNLQLTGAGTTGWGIVAGGAMPGTPGQALHCNRYIDNTISGVQVGICTLGFDADHKNIGTRIEGNRIATPGNPAARIGISAGFEDLATISGNQIEFLDQTSGTQDCLGLALGSEDFFLSDFGFPHRECSNLRIVGNRIGNISNSANRTAAGIALGPTGPGTTIIADNAVYSILSNATGNDFCAGIYLAGQSQPTASVQVIGNSVSLTGSTTGAMRPVYGLALGQGDPVVFARNNTIQVLASNGSSGGNGGSVAIASDTSSPANLSSDRNNFFVTAGADFSVGRTGSLVFGGINRTTLALWQSATGGDATSLSVAPQHTSTTNLAPLAGSPLLGAGVVVAGAVTDIQGSPRPNPPAIGAHELAQVSGLAGLSIAPGALIPLFDVARLGYNLRLPSAVSSVTVTPTAAVGGTAIAVQVNGGPAQPVTSGSPSPPLALQVGTNQISIQLTPPSGPAPPPTTVSCTREGALAAGDLQVSTSVDTTLDIQSQGLLDVATIGPGVAPVKVQAYGTRVGGGDILTLPDALRYTPPSGYAGDDEAYYLLTGANEEYGRGSVTVSVLYSPSQGGSVSFRNPTTVLVTFTGLPVNPNVVYLLEYTDDLTQPFRPYLFSGGVPVYVLGTSSSFRVEASPGAAQRFFRVVAVARP